jgi:hypothetical protein
MARRWNAVLARLGTPTGDGRIISPGALSSRDLPLPLSWQRESGEGHGGSVVVGRIDTISFDQDMVTATGSLLDEGEWSGVVELLENEVIGPSVDLDDLVYVVDDNDKAIITSARIAGATLVAIPAFADVSLTLAPLPAKEAEPEPAMDYDYDALYAAVGPDVSRETSLPPLEAFTRPTEVGPLNVSRETWGMKVSGYIGTRDTCHVGLPGCTTIPSSVTGYAHFLRKEQRTQDGTTVPVGVISVGGGHARPDGSIEMAMEHYDDPACATAKVFCGDDEYGVWVSGWILPYADPVKVQQLSDLDVSGDWRRRGGNLEMIGVCVVNNPGFPVLKKVHFSLDKGGQQTLIATFKVDPGNVSRETSGDTERARAAWARASWKERDDA